MFERLKELVSDFVNGLKKKEPALVPVRNQQKRYRNS
jgi:hypothetical protein